MKGSNYSTVYEGMIRHYTDQVAVRHPTAQRLLSGYFGNSVMQLVYKRFLETFNAAGSHVASYQSKGYFAGEGVTTPTRIEVDLFQLCDILSQVERRRWFGLSKVTVHEGMVIFKPYKPSFSHDPYQPHVKTLPGTPYAIRVNRGGDIGYTLLPVDTGKFGVNTRETVRPKSVVAILLDEYFNDTKHSITTVLQKSGRGDFSDGDIFREITRFWVWLYSVSLFLDVEFKHPYQYLAKSIINSVNIDSLGNKSTGSKVRYWAEYQRSGWSYYKSAYPHVDLPGQNQPTVGGYLTPWEMNKYLIKLHDKTWLQNVQDPNSPVESITVEAVWCGNGWILKKAPQFEYVTEIERLKKLEDMLEEIDND